MEATIEVAGLRKRFGPTAGAGRHVLHRPAGAGDRFRRAERRRQIHHDAGDPRPGRGRRGHRPDRRTAVPQPAQPLRHVGSLLDAAALQPSRTARNHLLWLAHSQGLAGQAGRRGDRAGRAGLGGPPQGGRLLARHAAAAGHRRRAARRPAGAHVRRAVQRHGPRGHRVDARLPALAGRRGPGGAGLQPPDERAAGHRRPARGGRPRPGHRRHQRGRADRRRLRWPGHAAHDGAGARAGGAGATRAPP